MANVDGSISFDRGLSRPGPNVSGFCVEVGWRTTNGSLQSRAKRGHTTGMLNKEPDVQDHPRASSPRPVPCNDATGRVLPITPEEQARDARATAAFVERMLAMPDEDPSGAWEEAMRDLDAQRPDRKLFEGLYLSWCGWFCWTVDCSA
jgi:hypothetical protein